MTIFNTQQGKGIGYRLQFETDDKDKFLYMQECARKCVDDDVPKESKATDQDCDNFKDLLKRFRHLLRSEYIRSFDEWDAKRGRYKKDIRQADEDMKTIKQLEEGMESVIEKYWSYCFRKSATKILSSTDTAPFKGNIIEEDEDADRNEVPQQKD